jgi:hypothetical protein
MLEVATMTCGKYECIDGSVIEITQMGLNTCLVDNEWHDMRNFCQTLVRKL